MIRGRVVAAGLALGVTLTACGGTARSEDQVATVPGATRLAPGTTAPVASTVAGLNGFATRFYGVAADPGQNLVFSPLSVAYAFAMLDAGARGNTAAQIDKAFGFPAGVAEAFNALTADLITSTAPPAAAPASTDSDPPPQPPVLTIANALFSQAGYAYDPAFRKTLTEQYGSGVQTVDFGKQQAALDAINQWADVHTAGRIPKILDHLDPATRLAILNAVYLEASWTEAFKKAGDRPFKVAGADVNVPMIDQEGSFGYATGSGWQSVTVPYFGGRLAMRVLLPTGSGTPADVLTPQVLTAAAQPAPTDVVLTLPKFDFGSSLDLVSLLKKVGVIDAFDAGHADLSGITTSESLFVDQAVQKANITVDELGTVASAVTALTAVPSSARVQVTPPVQFTVDRPFGFEIVDLKTGAPIFLGQVTDPRAH